MACAGYMWKLDVRPWANTKTELVDGAFTETLGDHVGVYLELCADPQASVNIEGRITLLSQRPSGKGHTVSLKTVMIGGQAFGFHKFISHQVFNDASSGFLEQNTVKFEVGIKIMEGYEIQPEVLDDFEPTADPKPQGLVQDLLGLLSSGACHDIVFLAGEERIHAHRAILMARSAVFSAMLAKDRFTESKQLEVFIDDVDAATLRALLHFLYADQLPEKACEHDPVALLAAADKYGIEGLRQLCEEHFLQMLTPLKAAEFLVLADCRACPRLKHRCLVSIKNNTAEAMASPGWTQHLAGNADLLNQVIGHIAGVSSRGSPDGGVSRGTKRPHED